MHRSILPLLVCFAFLFSNTCLAEAPRWYEVEVALIAYQDSNKIDHENWPEILISDSSNQAEEGSDSQAIPASPWSWLTWWNDDKHLNDGLYSTQGLAATTIKPSLEVPFISKGLGFEDKLAKLSKAKDLQIVWNQKWHQPIPEKAEANQAENAINIDFKAALNFDQTLKSSTSLLEAEITGQIYLYRSRYLHLVSKLNIQHWKSLEKTNNMDKTINILPNHANKINNIIPSSRSTPLMAIAEVPLRAAAVNQSRRMRSSELHYIDHPLLGILVRVTPLP